MKTYLKPPLVAPDQFEIAPEKLKISVPLKPYLASDDETLMFEPFLVLIASAYT